MRDPSDPSGAVALDEGKGTLGGYAPSGAFAIRLDSFAYSTEPLVDGAPAEEGKRYAVAKKLILGAGGAHKWAYDVSAMK